VSEIKREGKALRYLGDNSQKILTKQGEKTIGEAIPDQVKVIGLYFSMSTCGPCIRFTPKLDAAYREYRENHDDVEIIL
jgi:thiol-disulfide isomerase/thioredoxin